MINRTAFLWRDPLTSQLSLLRLTQSLLYALLFLFLINALVVSLAFWRAGALTAEHVALDQFELVGLDGERALLSVSGQLEDAFLMNYVQFRLTKPLDIYLLAAVGTDSAPVRTLLSIKVPAGELLNPITRKFSVSQIEIVFNERFPSFCGGDDEDLFANLPNFSVKIDFGVSSRAFWIPFWFTSTQTFPIDLSKLRLNEFKQLQQQPPPVKPKYLKFTETSNSFAADFKFTSEQFPPFARIDLPALTFELRQKGRDDFSGPSPHRIVSLSIPKQSLTGELSFALGISLAESDRRGISETLSAIRDKNLDSLVLSLVHNSRSMSPCQGLCQWLSALEIDFPVAQIVKLIPLGTLNMEFDWNKLLLLLGGSSSPLFLVNFNGVVPQAAASKHAKTTPTTPLSLSASIDIGLPRNYLSNLNLEFIKTPFPSFKTVLFADKGNRPSEHLPLLTSSINHILHNDSLKFDLVLTFNDLELLTQSCVKLLTGGEGRKVYLKGAHDSFLSSLILDPLSIELTSHLKPRFRHGKKLYLSDVLGAWATSDNNPKHKPAATKPKPQFSEIVRHKVNLVTESSKSEIVLRGHLNFADSSSVLNWPFVKVSWNELALSAAPISKQKSSPFLELVKLKVNSGGSCNVYLTPGKNPILLLHEGSVDFRIEMKHKAGRAAERIFLDAWKEFVRNLIVPDADDFVPFLLKAQGPSASSITTATLPSLLLINRITAVAAAFLKSSTNGALPENWANWLSSLAETTVKVAGMRGLTTQLLIEMPQMEICSRPKKFDSFSVDLRLEFAPLDLNICRRNQKSSKPRC